MFKDYSSQNLSPEEKLLHDNYVAALQHTKKKGMNEQETEIANDEYGQAISAIFDSISDPDKASRIIDAANEEVIELEKKDEAFERNNDRQNTKHVKETVPAIDIKFFCRNDSYEIPICLDFKLGVFVFWEMIVPHILKIAELVGCKYVYLFAADNTEEDVKDEPVDYSDPSFDPYADDEHNDEDDSNKMRLVNYYQTDLKFKPVSKYTVLKPSYEKYCKTLVQEVSKLEENRNTIWESHANDFELDVN